MDIAISIITPVWNRADLTMQFLYRNWALYSARQDIEFIIVDNGSAEDTRQMLSQLAFLMRDRLVVNRNEKNLGFGPGNNQGALIARGDILIFLSNDVSLHGDYIIHIEKILIEEPEALIGPEMLRYDTGWNAFDGRIIAYLAGWCLACRREIWERLGGFDERFTPCDYEDIDLSYRAIHDRKAALIEIPLPLSHIFGQSAAQLDGGRSTLTMRNRQLFIEKWGFSP